MNMNKKFLSAERKFFLVIILLAVLSVILLGFLLYQANTVRFGNDVTPNELNNLVQGSPAVVEYLEQEKDFEAHFITIANLVKEDQQRNLGRVLIWATGLVVLISGVLGFLAAKYLLRPVKEAYGSQERFMQDAAHELRNPLAAINVALSNTNKPSKSFVNTVRRQTSRLVNIVEDLLFLERRKPGDVIDEQNISDLLNDVLEDLQPSIRDKNLQVAADIEPDIYYKMDASDFVQLSKNLIDNAVKYSDEGQHINISLKKDKKVRLVVRDAGVGIPGNELNRIGDRFFRAKNVSDKPGTGLGIAIVKKILNAYGGKLEIDSKTNKGTKVTATL